MAEFSPQLAERIRKGLSGLPVSEQRMFGGITFLLSGNMVCCASANGLMVRVGKLAEPQALANPHARPCSGAGHRMPGFILVDPAGLTGEAQLKTYLDMAQAYVGTLPNKPLGKSPVKKRTQTRHSRGKA